MSALEQIKAAARGLEVPSESEYPFVVDAKDSFERPDGGNIVDIDLDEFFHGLVTTGEEATNEDKVVARRFDTLLYAIRTLLTDVKGWRIERGARVNVQIGGSDGKKFVVISTVLIES